MTTHRTRSLSKLQLWMQDQITSSNSYHEPFQNGTEKNASSLLPKVEELLTSSQHLSAKECLSIYQRSYQARLLECLHSLFPRLYNFLQEEVFNLFALEYISQHPSQSYSLNNLGQNFVQYLISENTTDETDQRWSQLIVELARLDNTFHSIYSAQGSEGQRRISSHELMQRTTSELLELTISLSQPVNFLKLSYPIERLLSNFEGINFFKEEIPSDSYALISRHQYRCQTLSLSKSQFSILKGLDKGCRVDSAVEQATGINPWENSEICERVRIWLLLWADHHLLMRAWCKSG